VRPRLGTVIGIVLMVSVPATAVWYWRSQSAKSPASNAPTLSPLVHVAPAQADPAQSGSSDPLQFVHDMAPPVNPPQAPKRMTTAVALSGAVILQQDGGSMVYKKKCEGCGSVQPGSTSSALPSRGSTRNSSFICTKCKRTQKVSITGR